MVFSMQISIKHFFSERLWDGKWKANEKWMARKEINFKWKVNGFHFHKGEKYDVWMIVESIPQFIKFCKQIWSNWILVAHIVTSAPSLHMIYKNKLVFFVIHLHTCLFRIKTGTTRPVRWCFNYLYYYGFHSYVLVVMLTLHITQSSLLTSKNLHEDTIKLGWDGIREDLRSYFQIYPGSAPPSGNLSAGPRWKLAWYTAMLAQESVLYGFKITFDC